MSCGAALVSTCPRCSAELLRGARFCSSCGTAVEAPSATNATGEMIKLVTILFADVVGSTAQAETMHPEDTRALMAEFFQAMSEEIQAEGGTVERLIGDAVMADFGVPIAREDDPVRAVRAAIRMLSRLNTFNAEREGGGQIQVRIGINTGEVSTGGSFGEQLLVMGDAVNVAARLEQAARPGTILIGERTARAVRDMFALEEVERLLAKGKADGVAAFLVTGELDAPDDQAPASLIPLIGRDAELRELQSAFTGVTMDRTPRLVTVIGDPGVGKSRLTREFLAWAEGRALTLFGRCLPYGDAVTFWPLREIARVAAGLSRSGSGGEERERLDDFVDSLISAEDRTARGLLRDALYATVGFQRVGQATRADPRDTFRRLLEGWRLLLDNYAQEQPVVVAIEDLHWADSAMLEVLEDLVHHVTGPVLFICPTRYDLIDAHPTWIAGLRNYTSINLDPLDNADSCQLMSLLLELENMPEQLTERILDRAEGNPFFLEQILNRLIDEGHFALREGRWGPVGDMSLVEVPENVQAAVIARLDLLGPQERRVIQLASVVGRTFSRRLLDHLAGAENLESIITTLGRRQLVVESRDPAPEGDTEYKFKHVLTRDVAYDTLPRRERGHAHSAVAGWMESAHGSRASQVADLVAHHFDRAYESLGDEECRRKARVYSIVAAQNAVSRFAVDQAEAVGRRAVDLSADNTERVEALEALADIHHVGGKSELAWAAYMRALASVGNQDQQDIARICASAAIIPTRHWGAVEQSPPDEEIERIIDHGMSALGDTAGRERCLLLVSKAFFEAGRDRSADAREAADEAVRLAERLADPDLISAALDSLSATYMHPHGRYSEVRRVTGLRLKLVPRLSDLSEVCDIYGMAAVSETLIGCYPDAIDHASRSAEIGRQLELGAYLHALNWRVHALFMAGDWDRAIEDEASIARLEGRKPISPPGAYSARSAAAILFCLQLRGHPDAKVRLEVMRIYSEETERSINVLPLAARALAHMGLTDEAWAWIDLSRRMYRAAHLEAACEVITASQDWDRALDVTDSCRKEAADSGLLALTFFADRLEGARMAPIGDHKRAETLLRRSAEGFASLGAVWEQAQSSLLLAEALSRFGQHEGALSEAGRALPVFQRLRSVRELERTRQLLSASV